MNKGEEGGFYRIVCIAKVNRTSVGGEALIAFGPYTFSATLRDPRPWCYGVFDYDHALAWGEIGSYCQVHTAMVGDTILFYNPEYVNSYYYVYGWDNTNFDANCGPYPPNLGDGYYYDC